MKTEFYKVQHNASDTDALRRAAMLLREGGLVAFPTETVYGLGASAFSADAAMKIYAAKGRPSDNPLIVHIAEPEEAEEIAFVPPIYYKLAEKFMPGPLTVVLPKRAIIPSSVTGGLDTVAVRCPEHPIALQLIRKCGFPIAAPSANRSGCPSPTSADHVVFDLNGRIEMIIDGGECEIGLESTVISLTETGCIVLRPGAVTPEMLSTVCETVTVAAAVLDPAEAGDRPLSPGMKYKHYAPSAQVTLVRGTFEAFSKYVQKHISEASAVVIAESERPRFASLNTLSSGQTPSAENLSHTLFALLREADERKYSEIFIHLPPTEGKYLAVYNRLIRAAAGKIVQA